MLTASLHLSAPSARDRVTLWRGGRLYASGAVVHLGHDRTQLLVANPSKLRAGRYVLVERGRRTQITIG